MKRNKGFFNQAALNELNTELKISDNMYNMNKNNCKKSGSVK